MMKLFYLGPEHSFSHAAAQLNMRRCDTEIAYIPKVPLENVVTSLRETKEDAALAIVPCYNYLEGLVQETLDLIYENQVGIVGSQRLPIRFGLGGYERSAPPDFIISHPKALAQSSEYLCWQYPSIPHITAASTSEGVKHVCKNRHGFAIAGLDALRAYGVPVIAEDVGNTRHGKANFTDFFLIGTAPVTHFSTDAQHFTMIAVTPHIDRVGLLEEILFQIAYYDLNLAKIHSRPAIDDVKCSSGEPQMFYLEIMCHIGQENFQRCIEALQYKFSLRGDHCDAVRVLGSYPAPHLTAVAETPIKTHRS